MNRCAGEPAEAGVIQFSGNYPICVIPGYFQAKDEVLSI